MSFSINRLSHKEGEKLHYDPGMRRHFEQYMGWLRTLETNETLAVDSHQAYKYEGDFYGLLKVMGVPPDLHWLVMRLNDITNPLNFPRDMQQIMVPNLSTVSRIMQRYRSQTKKGRR